MTWPARASSAIPQPLPDDPVVAAGKLWEFHASVCARGCSAAEPRCDLGRQMYAFYVFLVDSEPERR